MSKASFSWIDPLLLDTQLSEEERMIRDAAAEYAQGRLRPRIHDAFRNETTDASIFREMGELGLLGITIPEEYGGANLNYVSYGLIAREIERVDSGYRSMMSVQSSLVMLPIYEFGSEAQKQKYLPKLATGEWIGCFGLTEPNYGSDAGGMITRAKKVTGGFSLTGSKMWISNSPIADVFVVWAKNDEGVIRVWNTVNMTCVLQIQTRDVTAVTRASGSVRRGSMRRPTFMTSCFCPGAGALGHYVIASCSDRSVRIFQGTTGKEVLMFYSKAPVYCMDAGSASTFVFGDSFGNVYAVAINK